MRPPVPLKGGAEQDAFTAWRRWLVWSRGQVAKIKRAFNRRVRRGQKQKLKKEQNGPS